MSSIVSLIGFYGFFVDFIRAMHSVTFLLCLAAYVAGAVSLPRLPVNGMDETCNELTCSQLN